MIARKITIDSIQQEKDLRKKVTGGLGINMTPAQIAYLCAKCGTPVAFASSTATVSGNSVQCSSCGTMNTV